MDREEHFQSEFLYVQFESGQVLTLVYPAAGTQGPPSNEKSWDGCFHFQMKFWVVWLQSLGKRAWKGI